MEKLPRRSPADNAEKQNRKFKDQQSHAFPVWNGIFDHYHHIGEAIWVFLWLIDKITADRNGLGIVLGGKPVRVADIMADLKGCTRHETIRTHLTKLAENGYIRVVRRTPVGQILQVYNSKKIDIWRSKVNRAYSGSLPERSALLAEVNRAYSGFNKDSAVTQQKTDTASNTRATSARRSQPIPISRQQRKRERIQRDIDTIRELSVGSSGATKAQYDTDLARLKKELARCS